MKLIKLKHIAHLYSGITVRESVDKLPAGDYKLLKFSDLPKKHFKFSQQGTNIQMLSINAVQNLPVSIPPLEEQKAILARQQLLKQEQVLYENLLALRKDYYRSLNQQALEQL